MNPIKQNDISRREFIRASTLFAVAISMPVISSCKRNDETKPLPGKDCVTTDDILGPYYKAGSPFREDIIPAENGSAPLFIQGKVYTDCETVLKDSIVEIWNANSEGAYDNATFNFRGQYKTLTDGIYRFKTIIPGRYLNGSTFRPSHIHFRITAPNHQELVSQIYFKDDPFNSTDPWASNSKAAQRILTIGKDDNGIDTVTFDIYLTPLT